MTPTASAIEVRSLTKGFGGTTAVAGISFRVEEGGFTSLLGPSGCGKTTTLRMLAGLERPDTGEIEFAGRLAASSARHVFVPPERRNVGVVFQSYALWSHMTVFDQVAYPLKVRHLKVRLRERVLETLEMVGLSEHAGRYPSQLSGGQQQRVALARALVFGPSVLLLDEPLSNLDAELRTQVRAELSRIHRETGVTTVYVTHDQSEALALSDRVLVMCKGEIIEDGSPRDIYDTPRSVYSAHFVGAANCLWGRLCAVSSTEATVELDTGDEVRGSGDGLCSADIGGAAAVIVRAEDVIIGPGPVDNANRLVGVVRNVTYLGTHKQLLVEFGATMLTVNASKDMRDFRNHKIELHLPVTRTRIVLA